MLTLINSSTANKRYQRQMDAELRASLGSLGKQLITYRPSQALMNLHGRGHSHLYFTTERQDNREVFWNSFGLFDKTKQAQEIILEINVSFGAKRNTAGLFAKDVSERVFLLHTGRVGGGRPGIGQAAFLAWHKPKLVSISGYAQGTAIIVGELGSNRLASRLEAYVRSVAKFKEFVASGGADTKEFQEETHRWREYRREFSGRKRASVDVDLDYITYHGDVIEALRRWGYAQSRPSL